MTTTHVFIVDTNTFKYHLNYLFAGTGARDTYIDFNNNIETSLHHSVENNLVGMISDSQRVRKGDYIIFYLQQNYKENICEGKFYGIFKAKEDPSFLDNNNSQQFLKKELVKSLTFRTLIEPFEVYSKGVTEWEALDEIKYIQAPNQMLWSLIYRKLKGNRGNTMITIYESERLFKLLRDKNKRQIITGPGFNFNTLTQEISANNIIHSYTGRKEPINILPRLIYKYSINKSFEGHLQSYIIQNIGRDTNTSLDKCLLNGLDIEWLGNEVSCGVGMQKIDIMVSAIDGSTRHILPIELKTVEAATNNVIQLQRYIDWLEQYYIPNRISDIHPILITKKFTNKNSSNFKNVINSFTLFNEQNSRCYPIKYIEYEVRQNNLEFKEIDYLSPNSP